MVKFVSNSGGIIDKYQNIARIFILQPYHRRRHRQCSRNSDRTGRSERSLHVCWGKAVRHHRTPRSGKGEAARGGGGLLTEQESGRVQQRVSPVAGTLPANRASCEQRGIGLQHITGGWGCRVK